MNLVMVGLFTLNTQGLEGAILQQLSHGLVSGALFLCIGVVYDRHHTRLVKYMGFSTYNAYLHHFLYVFYNGKYCFTRNK